MTTTKAAELPEALPPAFMHYPAGGQAMSAPSLDELEALAKKHGALSYRNRADTQHPAYGFTPKGLETLIAEVREEDKALIEQLYKAIAYVRHTPEHSYDANLALKQMNAALVAAEVWLGTV